MLSAAHVLAMDAKNLLDVADSMRIRYPDVDHIICNGGILLPEPAPEFWIEEQFWLRIWMEEDSDSNAERR